MECLNEDAKKEEKKDALCTSGGRDDQIDSGAMLLNIKYEFYRFSGDLIETIN